MALEKGLVHVYTGFSKGKTTAAAGLAIRALGNGLKVLFIQFLKGRTQPSGEAAFLANAPGAEVIIFADQRHPFFCKPGECDEEELKKSIQDGFALAVEKINSGNYDLVILDEINNCMKERWLDPAVVAEALKARPEHVEVVLTGRGCPKVIAEMADYVTEMNLVRHPAERGIRGRRGVEY